MSYFISVIFHWGRLQLRSSSIRSNSIGVIFHWGHLLLSSSSIEDVFLKGHLLLRSSSIKVVFHWGHLLLRSSSIEVSPIDIFFIWNHFPSSSSSIKVVFHLGCLPLMSTSMAFVFHWCYLLLRLSSKAFMPSKGGTEWLCIRTNKRMNPLNDSFKGGDGIYKIRTNPLNEGGRV